MTRRLLADGTISGQGLRQLLARIPGSTTARPLGGRGGVRYGTPTTTVEVSGSTWTCHAHSGVLDTGSLATYGPYPYSVDADETGTVTSAHATLSRIDTLYVQLNDNVLDSSGSTGATVALATGTAGSGTPASVPTRSVAIAYLTRASAASGGAVTVSWVAPYLDQGVIPVRDTTERDAITWGTAQSPAVAWRADTLTLESGIGTTWDHLAGGTPSHATQTIPATSSPFLNTTMGVYSSATWSWTPTRSGVAEVRAVIDVSAAGAGFGLFSAQVNAGGTGGPVRILFEGEDRRQLEVPAWPFRVRAGVSVALNLWVSVYIGTGGVNLNSGIPISQWEATVR